MATKPLKKLNTKHYLFIERYLENGFNGAEAYRKIFNISDLEKSKKAAYILLQDDLIKEAIKDRQAELSKKYDINKENIIRDLIDIKNSNFLDYYTIEQYTDIDKETGEEVIKYRYILKDLEDLSLSQQRCIKQIKMGKYGPELVLHDKLDSIEKLSKLLGFYDNTVNIDTRIDTSSLSNLTFEELEKLLNNSSKE